MSSRRIKKEILTLLQEEPLEDLFLKLEPYSQKDLISPLFSALCRIEPVLRWHAISAFGHVVTNLFQKTPESSRIVMRRFLWSLNDESGGIGWGAPEALGEVMYNCPQLFKEYHHMLISYMREDGSELLQDGNFLELPELQAGLLWGVGRLANRYQEELLDKDITKDVMQYLNSPNGDVRGMAIWCLGNLSDIESLSVIKKFSSDQHELTIYYEGEFIKRTISEICSDACNKINAKQSCIS